MQPRRNRQAALRFFRRLLKRQGGVPTCVVTDKLRSYAAAHRQLIPSMRHCTTQYANNRAEVSHQATRLRKHLMRRFKSPGHAQRLLAVHGAVLNLFRVGRHLLRGVTHRRLRADGFTALREATCVWERTNRWARADAVSYAAVQLDSAENARRTAAILQLGHPTAVRVS